MAPENGEEAPTSPLVAKISSPIKGVTRMLSDGYYAASYIPDQSDLLGTAVTEAVRHGPVFLALRDIWTCLMMFTLFPGVVTPFITAAPTDEFYLGWGRNTLDLFLLGFASVFEVILILLCIPMFLFLPGLLSVLIFVSGQFLLRIICLPLQGPSRVYSKKPTDPKILAKYERVSKERWFFFNGCCVSGYNLQQNVDLLAETFRRPVFAIHNRTYGVLGDLFECILQRSFNLFTEETRVSYEYVKAYCTDPEVKKVVLIAHSQGCIMASQILDQLYVDLPAESVGKIEVYTFGNAASHFNNPLRKIVSTETSIDKRDAPSSASDGLGIQTDGASRKPVISEMLPERVIAHIEHYCNSQDMVTRWGALYSAKQILQNRFCGHIFINEGVSGHMLNQHYLSDLFPIHHRRAGSGHAPGTSSEDIHGGVPFLDRIVHLDTATITQRRQQAVHQLAVMRHESAPVGHTDHSDHSHVAHASEVHDVHESGSKADHNELTLTLGEGVKLTSKDLSGAEGSRISVVKRPTEDLYQGKTVRQLSRLWRYLDGEDPDKS